MTSYEKVRFSIAAFCIMITVIAFSSFFFLIAKLALLLIVFIGISALLLATVIEGAIELIQKLKKKDLKEIGRTAILPFGLTVIFFTTIHLKWFFEKAAPSFSSYSLGSAILFFIFLLMNFSNRKHKKTYKPPS